MTFISIFDFNGLQEYIINDSGELKRFLIKFNWFQLESWESDGDAIVKLFQFGKFQNATLLGYHILLLEIFHV